MAILKKFKNELYSAVQQAGFQPSQFECSDGFIDGQATFKLTFRDSKLNFIVRVSPTHFDRFECAWTSITHLDVRTEWWPQVDYQEMAMMCFKLEEWLGSEVTAHVEEADTPDYWAEATSEAGFMNPGADLSDSGSNFSAEEKAQVRATIKLLEGQIVARFDPNAEQLRAIQSRLDYLCDAVDRLNKTDWKAVLMSVIVGIGVNLTVGKDDGAVLWQLVRTAFAGVSHLLQ